MVMMSLEHFRHHKVPSTVKLREARESGLGVHTEEIMDGMEKIKAISALVENVLIWRAQYIAWNVDIFKAEQMLFRMVYKEHIENPDAMDLLARIYFQQSKYEKAKELWNRAAENQPGNPALRRAANAINAISRSPASAVFRHKVGMLFRFAALLLLIFAVFAGGCYGVSELMKWAEGPLAVRNLEARFHYKYDSITKDMVYIPAEALQLSEDPVPPPPPEMESAENDGRYTVGFSRKKMANNREIGRIEVTVERRGSRLIASGRIPSIQVRYLVEQALWDVPGITGIDLRGLRVDRTYRVNKGDSLWIIAKRIYGNGSSWTAIAKANDLSDPSKLKIGQELSLPLGGDEYLEVTGETPAVDG